MGERDDAERKKAQERPTTAEPTTKSAEEPKLTLLAEEVSVGKEAVETGRLRVSTETHSREAAVDETLVQEHADVERIPVGRPISEMPSIRQEGETTVIPIVEEVVHVERRLVLKEEVRVTRRRKSERVQDRVTLRYQEAVVSRVEGETKETDTGLTDDGQVHKG